MIIPIGQSLVITSELAIILDVNDIHSGLELSLKESILKNSPLLQKDALFEKQSLISEFPEYLLINFTRFFWKAKEGVKAKILRVTSQRGLPDLFFRKSISLSAWIFLRWQRTRQQRLTLNSWVW